MLRVETVERERETPFIKDIKSAPQSISGNKLLQGAKKIFTKLLLLEKQHYCKKFYSSTPLSNFIKKYFSAKMYFTN